MMFGGLSAQALIWMFELLMVFMILLHELDGKSAEYNASKIDASAKESLFAFFDSFVSYKLEEGRRDESELQNNNELHFALEPIKTRLRQKLSEIMQLDQSAEKANNKRIDFLSLNSHFGNNTKFFEWMTNKLQVELHSDFGNCITKTKREFRDWVDELFNMYKETLNGKYQFMDF